MMRNFTIEEKDWLDLKESFEDEFENFEGISSVNQTKEEMYQSLGRHYDAVFKEQTGMSIEEFVQKHKNYYTFSEMVKHRLTGEKTSRLLPKRTRMTKEDKLAHRLKTNLVSEKGLGFSILNTKKFIEADYRVWWIADCIAWAITEKYGVEFDDKEKKLLAKANVNDLRKLEEFYADLKEKEPARYDIEVPDVELTSVEIREGLGRPELLNSDIHILVQKFAETTIERLSKRIMGEDGDSWIQFGEFGKICRVIFAKTGKLSNRNQQPEYNYRFIFDKIESLDFWLSVQLGFFDCRPKSYYQLKGGIQQIIRAVCWTINPTSIKEDDLFRIANITGKNIPQNRKTLNGYLNEAYKTGFIAGGEAETKKISGVRRKEHWYKIFKVKRLPEK